MDELPKVVWSHKTSESRAMKFTPFKLLYGEEAMMPEMSSGMDHVECKVRKSYTKT